MRMEFTAIKRLLPDDLDSWELFGLFRERVRRFIWENLPNTDAESAVYDMTNKWTQLPKTTGYWLGIWEDMPVAHMLSYVLESYGKPFVFIYQAECDDGFSGGVFQNKVMQEMDQWVDELNSIIPAGRPLITRGEMSTWRNPEAFARYLSRTGRQAAKVRSVIEFGVGGSATQPVL